MSWLARVRALLGLSAYSAPRTGLPSLGSAEVESAREAYGGQLAPPLRTETRWYLEDLEHAEHAADSGDLGPAARLMRAARRDGILAGVLSTRTDGLVRLPKIFRGNPEIVAALEEGHDSVRSVFSEMFPPAELALLAADGILLGVGVGELREVEGRDHPVFVRLDPEYLVYRWSENQWYFRSIIGLLPITPGDGRWILHTPGGRIAPWNNGLWKAIGRAFIRKEHAALHRDNWEATLGNPAIVAVSPGGATEAQSQSWFRRVSAWGLNTVFGVRPGYDVRVLESAGRGHESFTKTIDQQNNEIVICVAGQTVTTDGGTGFANADVHKSIRADLIQATADGLAFTINTQGLPSWIVARWGVEALSRPAAFAWDVTPPRDRAAEATALVQAANAIKGLAEAAAQHGRKINFAALAEHFSVPLLPEGDKALPSGARPSLSLVSSTEGQA